MKSQYQNILESILLERNQIEEDWGKTLAAGTLAAGIALSPLMTGQTIAKQEIYQQIEDNIVAKVIAGEAASEGEKGMHAVANVIQNRMKLKNKTAKEIITEPHQFSAYKDKNLMNRNYKEVKEYTDFLQNNLEDKNKIPDITGGATHYVTKDLYNKEKNNPNSWISKMKVTTTIGNHVFMKK